MTTNFGTDLYSADELDETREVSEVELVAQDAIWRLKTPRAMGILAEDAPDYGFDLLEAIGSVANKDDEAALPSRISDELTKDDRIETVSATVVSTKVGPAVSWSIRIACETSLGPFELVGSVADGELNLAVKLLGGAA